jgi:hypothetical protein
MRAKNHSNKSKVSGPRYIEIFFLKATPRDFPRLIPTSYQGPCTTCRDKVTTGLDTAVEFHCSIRLDMREMSDDLTGLSRNSSAPSSKHLKNN